MKGIDPERIAMHDRSGPPALSVVMPLDDDRGHGERALVSWLRQEPAVRLEIIAVADRSTAALARRARELLRPQDRFLHLPGGTEIELFRAGGEAARADVLLFTEAHCLAEPDAAAALLHHLASSSAAAVMLGGTPLEPNDFARFESRLHAEGRAQRPHEAWRRVSLRGLAVRAAAWREAGGFEVGCGRLAESILAVRLERRGWRVEDCAAARIRHANGTRPRHLVAALRPHGRGQGAWRERCEQGREADFLPPLPDWSERARWRRRLARHAARLQHAAWRDGHDGVASAARALGAALAGAVFGPSAPRLLAAGRAAAGLLLSRLASGEERRYRAYRRASGELLRWGVLEYAAASPLPAAAEAPIVAGAPLELLPAGLPDGVFAGFYAAERWRRAGDAEASLRWTRPVASLRLAMAAADCRVRLHAVLPPATDPARVGVWLNGHRAARQSDGAYRLQRRWFRRGDQILGFSSPAFRPARHGLEDPRILGIALFGLTIEP